MSSGTRLGKISRIFRPVTNQLSGPLANRFVVEARGGAAILAVTHSNASVRSVSVQYVALSPLSVPSALNSFTR